MTWSDSSLKLLQKSGSILFTTWASECVVNVAEAVSAWSDRLDYNSLSVTIKTLPLTVYLKCLSRSVDLQCDTPVWHRHVTWPSTLIQPGIPSCVFSCWAASSVATKNFRLGNKKNMGSFCLSSIMYTHIYMYYTYMCVYIRIVHTQIFVLLLEYFFLFCIVIVHRNDSWDEELSALDAVQKFIVCLEFTPGKRK